MFVPSLGSSVCVCMYVSQSWPSPTQCQFAQVLEGLSAIKIYGDFTTAYEAIGIDSVVMTTGDGMYACMCVYACVCVCVCVCACY